MKPATQRIEAYLLEKTRRVFGTGRAPCRPGGADSIHRMRVASRQLRVGLRLFGMLFPDDEQREIRRQLQRVTQALGKVRTLDVNLRLIRQAKLAGSAPLIRRLSAERAARADDAAKLLKELRADRFPARVRALMCDLRQPLSEAQLRAAAAERLRDLRRAVRRQFRRYCAKGGSRPFHRLRIAIKKYRYALEASDAVFPGSARERIATLEKMQDLMGRCHDLEMVMDWLSGARGKISAQQAAPLLEFFTEKHERRFAKADKFLHANDP
jgi:CHAD domain-containing protein